MSLLSVFWLPTHPTLIIKINKNSLHHQLPGSSHPHAGVFCFARPPLPEVVIIWVPLNHLLCCPRASLFCQLGGVCCLQEELLNFSPVYLVRAAAGEPRGVWSAGMWETFKDMASFKSRRRNLRQESKWNVYTHCPIGFSTRPCQDMFQAETHRLGC